MAVSRRTMLLGAAAASGAAIIGGAALYRHANEPARDGSALLALVLPDAQGHEQAVSQWKGKVIVANFWATWCGPCREEIPQFIAVQKRDGAKGLQFVGIAVDQADKVRQYVAESGMNYPALIGGYGAIELSKALGNELAALPFTIVLDRLGKVVYTQLGSVKLAALDRLLGKLLPVAERRAGRRSE